MATISKVDRTRIILDLVKDGDVTSLGDYAAVEQIGSLVAIKYAQAFWDAYSHPDLVDGEGDPRLPTNSELASNYINRIRSYHKEVLQSVRIPAAGVAARATETTTVATETTTELASDEVVE